MTDKAAAQSDRFVDDEEVAADDAVDDGKSKKFAEAVDKGVSASHRVRQYPLRETRFELPAFLNVCGESGHGFSEYECCTSFVVNIQMRQVAPM